MKHAITYRTISIQAPTSAGMTGVFILLLLLFTGLSLSAQANHGIIQGSIQDSFSQTPLEYVTVAVQHARFPKVLNGTITDEKGRFKITGMAPGQYRLSLTYVGYEEKMITDVVIKEDDILTDVGTLELSQGIGLAEIEVVGKRSLIEQHFDKIVYNTEDDIAAGQTLNDMLRKVPMVTVDAQGNVSLRGNGNVQVLIDGKPATMFGGNVADALRAIPPDQVKKIEVITMPSARYDAEGTAGVINIITKQTDNRGYNYSVNIAGGNQTLMGNTSFRAKGKKLGFNLSIGTSNMFMPPMLLDNTRQTESGEISTLLQQNGSNDYGFKSANVQTGLDYQINSFNELSTSLRYSPRHTTANQQTAIQLFANQALQSTTDRTNNMQTQSNSTQWAMDYRRKFRNPDLSWNSSVQFAQQDNNTTYQLQEMDNKARSLDEIGDNQGANQELTFSTDYLQTVNDKFKFEVGGKFISRNISTISTHEGFDPVSQAYQLIEGRSFTFPYQQNVLAAYAEGNLQLFSKLTLRTGLRLEHTENTIGTENTDQYTNLAPSLALNYLGGNTTLTLSYARRLSRPGLSYLNPFENRSDPFNWQTGNPLLQPELVDAFDLNFSQPIKQTFLNGSFYYHRTRDIIERQTSLLSPERTLTTYTNIGTNARLGLNMFLSSTISDQVNLKAGGNITYYQLNNTQLTASNTNQGTQLTLFSMLSCQLKKGWATEIVGAYFTPPWTAQQRSSAFYTYQLNLKKEILTTGSVSLTLVNPFHANINIRKETTADGLYSRQELQVPLRMINLGFQYSFNKNLAAEPSKNSGFENDDQKKAESSNPY